MVDENSNSGIAKYAELFVTDSEIDSQVLKDILLPYVKLSQKGDFFPNKVYHELDNTRKLLLYLLARKVLTDSKIIKQESAGPKAISIESGIKEGTVKPLVIKLSGEGLIYSAGSGEYLVPSHAIERVKEMLKDGRNGNAEKTN